MRDLSYNKMSARVRDNFLQLPWIMMTGAESCLFLMQYSNPDAQTIRAYLGACRAEVGAHDCAWAAYRDSSDPETQALVQEQDATVQVFRTYIAWAEAWLKDRQS